jgi:hypothetical protein
MPQSAASILDRFPSCFSCQRLVPNFSNSDNSCQIIAAVISGIPMYIYVPSQLAAFSTQYANCVDFLLNVGIF